MTPSQMRRALDDVAYEACCMRDVAQLIDDHLAHREIDGPVNGAIEILQRSLTLLIERVSQLAADAEKPTVEPAPVPEEKKVQFYPKTAVPR